MSQADIVATTPQPDSDRSVSPLPAQDASHGARVLNSKKSWFSSARSIISRGPSHPKGKPDLANENSTNSEHPADQVDDGGAAGCSRASKENVPSTTPLRQRPERHLSPKSAISSLRQHLTMSSHRHKRPALAELTAAGANALVAVEGMGSSRDREEALTPERLLRPNGPKGLVGSMRRLRRAATHQKSASNDAGHTQNPSLAKISPLPSTPIDVPAPPFLQLHLGPTALISSSFESRIDQNHGIGIKGDGGPGGFTDTQPLRLDHTPSPGRGTAGDDISFKQDSALQSTSNLSALADKSGLGPTSGPSTPVLGIGQDLDLHSIEVVTEMFERDVENKLQAQRKEQIRLKKMTSLDAMAEEYVSTPLRRLNRRPGVRPCLDMEKSIPSNMPRTSRKLANLQTPSTNDQDRATGHWQSKDMVSPGNVRENSRGHPTPSPTRSLQLPFRPKAPFQVKTSTRKPYSGSFDDAQAQYVFGHFLGLDDPLYRETGRSDRDSSGADSTTAIAMYGATSGSQTQSSDEARLEKSPTSDESDVFWKFSIKNWIHASRGGCPDSSEIESSSQCKFTGNSIGPLSPHDDQPSVPVSPSTIPIERPAMGKHLDFELQRYYRNMRCSTSQRSEESSLDHDHRSGELAALPMPPRPSLKLVTESCKSKRDLSGGSFAPHEQSSPRKRRFGRHTGGMSSDSIESDLKDAIVEHNAFQAAISEADVSRLHSSLVPETSDVFRDDKNELNRHDSVVATSTSSDTWQVMQHSVFDPLRHESHSAGLDSQDHEASGPLAGEEDLKDAATSSRQEDTLDECLEMFQHYNKSQEMLPHGSKDQPNQPHDSI